MIKKKKILVEEHIPEFEELITTMPEDSKVFVEKSMEIAHYIFRLMEEKGMKQKDLADKLGKSEAEVSKWLTGMHNYTLRSLSKLETALGEAVISTPKKYSAARLIYSERKSLMEMEQNIDKEPYKLTYNNDCPAKVIHFNNSASLKDEAIA